MNARVEPFCWLTRLLHPHYGWVRLGLFTAYAIATGTLTQGFLLVGAGVLLWAGILATQLSLSSPIPSTRVHIGFEFAAFLTLSLEEVLVYWEGGLDGPFSTTLYLLALLFPLFTEPRSAVLGGAWAILFNFLLRRFVFEQSTLGPWLVHAGFWSSFEGLSLIVLTYERHSLSKQIEAHGEQVRARFLQEAHRYRLHAAQAFATPFHVDLAACSSVEQIRQTVRYTLDVLRCSLHLHTAVLFWLDETGVQFRISELATEDKNIHTASFAAGDGVLGAVWKQHAAVSLSNLTPTYHIPYYLGPCPVQALLAIPLKEGEELSGILVLDRSSNSPFTEHEEALAQKAACLCLHAVQNERVFGELEKTKAEQGKLYQVVRALNSASGEQEVLHQGMQAAHTIVPFDCAAVTLFNDVTQMHEVRALQNPSGLLADYIGVCFVPNKGLVSMAVQNRCTLPYKGEFDAAQQTVLTAEAPWPNVPALLVLPLLLHDRALGTLILGSTQRFALNEAVRPLLEVLASHLAVSLSNAHMVYKLEQLAMSDALTGLLNRRALLERAEQKLAAAVRFDQPLSVVIVDLDHFKAVNDTYGHDVGDQVLKGLSEVLMQKKRATDLVARLGGEEFVVLCEQTDEQGALLLAERIREALAVRKFFTPQGQFTVTCSLGMATFPLAGRDWETLFQRADEALYASKRAGRNRATCFASR